MNMKEQIELSERLRLACANKSINEPKFVAQDKSGTWYHYKEKPIMWEFTWFSENSDLYEQLFYAGANENWRETLMEFITPKIEVGKRYWRRDGSVSGVVEKDHNNLIRADFYVHEQNGSWRKNGNPHDLDLIAEYLVEEKHMKYVLTEEAWIDENGVMSEIKYKPIDRELTFKLFKDDPTRGNFKRTNHHDGTSTIEYIHEIE